MNANAQLTHGKIKSKLFLFALPIAVCSIFQQLLNTTDTAILGRFSSYVEMAAVGDNASVINLIISMVVGFSVGANIVIAHLIGEKKLEKMRSSVLSVLIFGSLCGVVLLIICNLFAKRLLALMETPEVVIDYAVTYLKVFSFGLPALTICFFGAAILRGMGNSTLPTVAVISSGIINVILNIITVCGFKAGILGVAISTDISNYICAFIILTAVHRKTEKADKAEFSKEVVFKTLKYGFPAGIQGVVFAVSNMIIQSAINSFGKEAIAGAAIVFNFECIGYYIIDSYNQASITFTGQNFQSKKYGRCKEIYSFAVVFAMMGCLVFNVLCWFGRDLIIPLFTTNETVAKYAIVRFSVVLLFQWIASVYEVSGATLRGMGHPFLPSVLTIIGTCVVRVVWILFIFPLNRTFNFLLIVYPLSWLLTSIIVAAAYFTVRKKELN